MEEIKNKNNKTKNESELVETTNPYILELCDDQGNKKIVPVLPVANFTGLTSNTFANLDNTCMTNRILFDQLDPLWALNSLRRGFHPITKEEYNALKFENEQILTFFGYPSDFFTRIKKDIKNLYKGTIKFIQENGSGKIRILNSFFLGKGDEDLVDVDPNLKNNIIFNFVKGTNYEIKNSNGDKSCLHRTVLVNCPNGTTSTRMEYYLPTFIDEKEVPRYDDDRFRENKVFWRNMNQILEQSMYENLKSSDLDFIKEFINFDDFFTIKDKGDDSTEYFAIVKKQESCKSAEDLEKSLCKGAKDLIDNILKSEECKSLNKKGFKISKSSIYEALMRVSALGCESTLAYPKIVPEKSEQKLSLAERTELAKKDFLDAIKAQIAIKHKVRIYKQKNEIWDWEARVFDKNNIYSVTNYWQAVIPSVFLKFRHLDKEKRQIIFYNFVNCYESMKSKDLDLKDYFFKDLNSNFGYKTPILIKKLLKDTDLALSEKDWEDLAKSIASIFEMLGFAEHVTQMLFFEKLESKDKFDDLFLLHNNKLIVQIPELVKLWLKKYVSPAEHYRYNCLVDTELIHSDGSNSGLISSSEIGKISEFKFHYDGLPYIFGISRESLKRFIDNFEVEDCGFDSPGTNTYTCTIVENREKYYLGIKKDISEFEAKQYINRIICLLSKIDVERLYYLCPILPENLWRKSGLIDYYFFGKNGFDVSDLEKIISIIKISGHSYGLAFELLLTSKNISPSLILDMFKKIFNNYSQKVFDYKKMINENAENHKNIKMESEMNYCKTVFIKFLEKALSSSSYRKDVFESINNFLIERNKSEPNVFDALMIVGNVFGCKERANLFKYFSLMSEKFILENLDYCFVKWYISEISETKTIKKIILETQKFPNKTDKKLLKKLIKFNPKFFKVLREMEIYKSAKESYDFKKIIEKSNKRKNKISVADYSNNYHKDLFGDTYTDSEELSENEKTENTKHNIKEKNNCLEKKKSIRSYIHRLIYTYEKSKNDRPNKHDVNNEKERK